MTISIDTWKANIAEYIKGQTEDELKKTCVLCRLPLNELCVDCIEDESEERCFRTHSTCGHCLHFHCLSLWLNYSGACPVCNKEWDFSTYD